MALANTTVWEVRTTGFSTNGGGFNPNQTNAGTDYSQQNNPFKSFIKTLSTAAANSNALVGPAGSFSSDMVGNIIYISSGTNFVVGRYEITFYVSDTTVILDRTPTPSGAGSLGSGNIGGALNSLATLINESLLIAGNTVWIKEGTYTDTPYTLPGNIAASDNPITIIGYSSTRGDASSPVAVFDNGGAASTILDVGTSTAQSGYYTLANIEVRNNGSTSVGIRARSKDNLFINCKASAIGGHGFNLSGDGNKAIGCSAYDFGRGGNSNSAGFRVVLGGVLDYCISDGNNVGSLGFRLDDGCFASNCSALQTTSFGYRIDTATLGQPANLINCIAYKCGDSGFRAYASSATTDRPSITLLNCISALNSGFGFEENFSSSVQFIRLINCAEYNNTSGATFGNIEIFDNLISLTEDPFVDGLNKNFLIKGNIRQLIRTGLPLFLPGDYNIATNRPLGILFDRHIIRN